MADKDTLTTREKLNLALLVFLSAGVLFVLMLARNSVFPFGERSLLISDMNSQYIDFMMEYRRILVGQGSLFYSWHAGIGMNFPGILAYYLASPFIFLLVPFPERLVIDAVTLITGLKLACAAAAMTWFLSQHDPNHTDRRASALSAAGLGLLYGFSGYAISYSFNIMWLDGVILLPLICAVLERLQSGRRWIILTILYTILLLSQFYIAYMVILFTLAYGFIHILLTDQADSGRKRLLLLVRLAGSLASAAGLSAFLLLPAFFVLKNNMGLIGQSFPLWGTNFSLFSLTFKFFPASFDGIKGSLPHIFCGLVSLFGLGLYFLNPGVRRKERLLFGLLLGFLLLGFWLKPLNFIWHAFDHPSWFPYRNSFLFIFLTLTLACRGLTGKTGRNVAGVLIPLILMLTALAVYWHRFQNQGFLLAAVSGILPLIYAGLLWKPGTLRSGTAAAIVLLTVVEIFLNSGAIFAQFSVSYLPRQTYLDFYDRNHSALAPLAASDEKFYRTEKKEIRTYNDPMSIGYAGIGHFSSTASTVQSRFLKKMGFDCYATWCTYHGATVFSDALLGIKYIYSGDLPQNRFYLPAGKGIRQNPYALPPMFFLDGPFESLPSLEADQPLEHQEQIMQAMLKSGHPYTAKTRLAPAELINLSLSRSENDSVDVYTKVVADKPAAIRYRIHVDGNNPAYLFIPSVSLNYDVWLDSKQIFSHSANYTPFLVDLTDCSPDSELSLTIDLVNQSEVTDDVTLYTFDYQQMREMITVLSQNYPAIRFDGKTGFNVRFQPEAAERALLTSIPFDAGWTAKVDGKPVAIKKVLEGLIGIPIPASAQTLELTFVPYGFKAGAIISGLSWIVLAGWILICGKKRAQKDTDRTSSD